MKFEPATLDYALSPYTGMTRQSWIEAAEYILGGFFSHLKDINSPAVVHRKETEVTYPHINNPDANLEVERRAEYFEGLARTFLIAAPLVAENPDLVLNGINVRDYYKNQVIRACTPGDELYVCSYTDLQKLNETQDPFRVFQQTVETCALVICLDISRRHIWECYTKEEKNLVAEFLSDFAHSATVPQNWRLFNMLDMAFLSREGYAIDEEIMKDHGQAVLNYYAGSGWYRDGQSFDYYSSWAFNVYAPIWNQWYGYENEPFIARKFEEASNELMKTYADFFDEDGFTNMWGRSNIYRFASVSAFDGNCFLRNSTVDYGLARRVSSGSLLQFLGRGDCITDGIIELGFYKEFAPLVQGYSCAESPFWLGKAFLCLHLDKDHPFWTEKENNGTWEKLSEGEVKETVLNGPALCFTNHKSSGETILRTGKVVKQAEDLHGMWNYSKLSFNTKYPWESTPVFTESRTGVFSGEVESQQYVLKDLTSGKVMNANATFWYGSRNGVLYRRQFFDYSLKDETHWIQAMNAADFAVPYGIFRVDVHRLFRRPVRFTLGSYGFPDNGTDITFLEDSAAGGKAIVLRGHDFTGKEKQLAFTVYDGWKNIDFVRSSGSNPDSEKSVVPYAYTNILKNYGGKEPYALVSQTITKESHVPFTGDEIFPVKSIEYSDSASVGAYGDIKINLKNKKNYVINFEGLEGGLML